MSVTVIFLFTFAFSDIYVNERIPNQYVTKFDEFSLDLSHEIFKNDDNSIFFESVDTNDLLTTLVLEPNLTSRYDYIHAYQIFFHENYCYIVDNYLGLYIMDSKFNIVGTLSLGFNSYERRIFVSDDYAYVINYYRPLYIIDIKDKTFPRLISYYNSLESNYIDLLVREDFLFLTKRYSNFEGSVVILDITNKALPSVLDTFTIPNGNMRNSFLKDNHLFITESTDGLRILDISNVTSISEVTVVDLPEPQDVFIDEEDYAYVVDDTEGLRILDVSNIEDVQLLGVLPLSGFMKNRITVKLGSQIAFVACWGNLHIVNVTSKITPSLITSIESQDFGNAGVRDVAVSTFDDNIIYISEIGMMGMEPLCSRRFNISILQGVTQINDSNVYIGGEARYSVLQFPYLFVCDNNNGIVIYNVRYGDNLQIVGHFDTGGYSEINVLGIDGKYIYVPDTYDHSTRIIEMNIVSENEVKLTEINRFRGTSPLSEPFSYYVVISEEENNDNLYEDILFIGYHNGEFAIWDVSNKSNPVSVGLIKCGSNSMGTIFVDGDYGYVSLTNEGICVLDISNFTDIKILQKIETEEWANDIFVVSGGYVVVAESSDGIKIYDISDDMVVVEYSSCDTSNAAAVFVQGDVAFVSEDGDGISIIDISDKENPKKLHTITENLCGVKHIFVRDNHMYVSDGKCGIKIFRLGLQINGNKVTFPQFCGTVEVNVRATTTTEISTISTSVTESFILEKEDYCNSRGECLENYQCLCIESYEGDTCNIWSCDGIEFFDTSKVCNGNGDCTEPDTCNCNSGYTGRFCQTNTLYFSVMTPLLTLFVILLILLIIFGFCVLLFCCCFVFASLLICIGGLCFIVILQTKGLRKFGRLRNFEVLLHEQRLEDSTDIAHLRIRKELFTINFDDIKLESVIGEGGSSSCVFKAQWSHKTCAFKCFKTHMILSSQPKFDEFEREVEILGSLNHPNIIRFFGASMKQPRVGILMEYASKGEIMIFIGRFKDVAGSSYPIFQKIRMMGQVSSALDFLHCKNVIHRDLKSENVLVDENEDCKLTDFGLSKLVERMSQRKTKNIGTDVYMAPEIILHDDYTEKCDVYSFAILLYIILTENLYPYGQRKTRVELRVANSRDFRPDLKDLEYLKKENKQWIIDMIVNCWEHDPAQRYSFREITKILDQRRSEFINQRMNNSSEHQVKRNILFQKKSGEGKDDIILEDKTEEEDWIDGDFSKEDIIGFFGKFSNEENLNRLTKEEQIVLKDAVGKIKEISKRVKIKE